MQCSSGTFPTLVSYCLLCIVLDEICSLSIESRVDGNGNPRRTNDGTPGLGNSSRCSLRIISQYLGNSKSLKSVGIMTYGAVHNLANVKSKRVRELRLLRHC